jgi:hypothetical protein
MWIETDTGTASRSRLICDECGSIFEPELPHRHSREAVWHAANVAGWIRTARIPDRHACAAC